MPLFVTTDLDNKLDATDAEFVDIFHTNRFDEINFMKIFIEN